MVGNKVDSTFKSSLVRCLLKEALTRLDARGEIDAASLLIVSSLSKKASLVAMVRRQLFDELADRT